MKLKKLASFISLLAVLVACSYEDEFDLLNQELSNVTNRLETLESQIEGFSELSTGLNALDTKIGTLGTVVNAIPNNVGFSSSVGDIQEKIEMLEEALDLLLSDSSEANISAIEGLEDLLANVAADLGGSLQEQVDALNLALGLINEDVMELLKANNVYEGDLVISSEAELDNALQFLGDRESLIINGAVFIGGYEGSGPMWEMDATSKEKLEDLTSKITAILGKNGRIGYVGFDFDENDSGFPVIPFVGFDITLVGIEVIGVDTDISFPNLLSLRGPVYIYDIGGTVDLSAVTVQNNSITELDYFFDDSFFGGNTVQIADVAGDIRLSSIDVLERLYIQNVRGMLSIENLRTVRKSVALNDIGSVVPLGALETVGEDMILNYGAGYRFPELTYVGGLLDVTDYSGNSVKTNPTEYVDFPKLAHVGSPIQVNNGADNVLDNVFSLATYINILGYFSNNFGNSKYGFGAPMAETVIINGDSLYEEGESVVGDLYVNAPLAEVTLTFTETYEINGYGVGDIELVFKTLTANNLTYIDGNMKLVGPAYETEQPEVVVNFPELYYIYGFASTGYVDVSKVFELHMPKYIQSTEIIYTSGDLVKFTAASIYDNNVGFTNLESLTLTALDDTFDFLRLSMGTGVPPSTIPAVPMFNGVSVASLTEVNITGKDCSASVFIGSNDNGTAYDSIETVTLAGTFYEAQVFGAAGLTTINTSGEIDLWSFADNGAVTTFVLDHTPGNCGN